MRSGLGRLGLASSDPLRKTCGIDGPEEPYLAHFCRRDIAEDDGDDGADLNRRERHEAEHRAQRPKEGDGEGRGRYRKR